MQHSSPIHTQAPDGVGSCGIMHSYCHGCRNREKSVAKNGWWMLHFCVCTPTVIQVFWSFLDPWHYTKCRCGKKWSAAKKLPISRHVWDSPIMSNLWNYKYFMNQPWWICTLWNSNVSDPTTGQFSRFRDRVVGYKTRCSIPELPFFESWLTRILKTSSPELLVPEFLDFESRNFQYSQISTRFWPEFPGLPNLPDFRTEIARFYVLYFWIATFWDQILNPATKSGNFGPQLPDFVTSCSWIARICGRRNVLDCQLDYRPWFSRLLAHSFSRLTAP